tara:strand:- start:5187 stop:7778 length:2592 start_codon:yes stop_codon:yes gene_type:complete
MAYTEEQLQQLVSEIANEVVHGEYPTLQLPDDLKFECNVVAETLGRGRQHGLDILSSLQKRKMDAVTIGALEVLCILFVDADVSVRARMLEPETMCYIFSLMGDTGAHAPSVRVAGLKLLCCLIGGQQAQTLESLMTKECLEQVAQYLNAGATLKWMPLALEVVVTTSKCTSGRVMLLELDIAGHLHGCLEAAKAEPEVLVSVIGTLWHLYGVCSPFDDLRALELLAKLVDYIEVLVEWEASDDMWLALALRCLRNLCPEQGKEMLNRLVRVCAGILTLAPGPSNVLRQILALLLIAIISSAPTSARKEILDATHPAYETITIFFNQNCQVQASEQLQALFAVYAELAQTMRPETRQDQFLMHKVLLHVLNTVARSQHFTESAKLQLLRTLQQPYETQDVPCSPIPPIHRSFIVEVLKWHGTDKTLVDAGLKFLDEYIISYDERLAEFGAKDMLCVLLQFNQKHLQHREICVRTADCLQKLLKGAYAEDTDVPVELRIQLRDGLAKANLLLLRQLGTDVGNYDLLRRAVQTAEDIKILMNANAGFLTQKFKCSMFDTDRSKREAEVAFVYVVLLQFVRICNDGGFRPPQSMVTAVSVLNKDTIKKLAGVLKNMDDPHQNCELFLWWAVVFVCGPAKAKQAKDVEEVRQVLKAQEVARVHDPTNEDELLRLCKKSLKELLADIDAEEEKRLRMQKELIEQEELEELARTTKKKKSRKKKEGVREAAALHEAGAAEKAEVAPAPAPASNDAERERGPRQTGKKNKKKSQASGGAVREPAPAPAAAACDPGDKTTLPSPPRAASDCDTGSECVVCMESLELVAIIPCGHVCLCAECAQRQEQRECPICRGHVDGTLRLFFPGSHSP